MDCTSAVSKNQAIIWAGNYNAAQEALGLSVRCGPSGLQPKLPADCAVAAPSGSGPATSPIRPQLFFFTGYSLAWPESCISHTEEMKMTIAPHRPGLPGKQALPESLQTVNATDASAPPLSPLAEGVSNRAISIPPAKKPVGTEARRCSERGCIYPAGPGESGRCLQHQRQQREPALFHSRQPSMILLDCAKFGLPEEEPEDSRFRDRRRLAAQREAFLGGAA